MRNEDKKVQYVKGLDHFHVPDGVRTAVTFGKFDGLHRGHQKLVSHVCEHADHDTWSVVCAFDMTQFLNGLFQVEVQVL